MIDTSKIRLQKLLADAGYGSRRSAERMIISERVTLNGQIAKIGDKATTNDTVYLDGHKIDITRFLGANTQTLILNKASGVICSSKDDKGRKRVYKLLPKDNRWIMIGRLDINSSGLLLFTNHGELAKRLMHPSYEVVREYLVRILGELDKIQLEKLTKGMQIEGNFLQFKSIKLVGGEGVNHWYSITLTTGKNREIRRLLAVLNFQISRLMRVRYGEIKLPRSLRANQYDYLSDKQTNTLLKSVGLM